MEMALYSYTPNPEQASPAAQDDTNVGCSPAMPRVHISNPAEVDLGNNDRPTQIKRWFEMRTVVWQLYKHNMKDSHMLGEGMQIQTRSFLWANQYVHAWRARLYCGFCNLSRQHYMQIRQGQTFDTHGPSVTGSPCVCPLVYVLFQHHFAIAYVGQSATQHINVRSNSALLLHCGLFALRAVTRYEPRRNISSIGLHFVRCFHPVACCGGSVFKRRQGPLFWSMKWRSDAIREGRQKNSIMSIIFFVSFLGWLGSSSYVCRRSGYCTRMWKYISNSFARIFGNQSVGDELIVVFQVTVGHASVVEEHGRTKYIVFLPSL